MPKGYPKSKAAPVLKGSVDPGYRKTYEEQNASKAPKEISHAPDVLAALETVDVDPLTEGGIDLKARLAQKDPYEDEYGDEIGNGGTLPFRYRNRPTLAFTSCSEPAKDVNRGCPLWYRCPLRDVGSGNFAYQNKKTGQIRASNCYDWLITGMARNRDLTMLPGIGYSVSEEVTWAPHPDGSPVKMAPGEPKTHLVHKSVRNPIPGLFDGDLIRQYEVLRRRGEVA